METKKLNLLTRNDTILGVCEALGQDFNFNPLWLRIAFTLGMFFDPFIVGGVYLALAVVVLGSRLLFPQPKQAMVAIDGGKAPALTLEDASEDMAAAA